MNPLDLISGLTPIISKVLDFIPDPNAKPRRATDAFWNGKGWQQPGRLLTGRRYLGDFGVPQLDPTDTSPRATRRWPW